MATKILETGIVGSLPTPPWLAGPAPLWAPVRAMEDGVMAEARAKAEQDRDREYRRLFYVALTRAADRLYICGFEGKAGRKEHCWYDMAWRVLAAMPEIERPDELAGGLRLANSQGVPPPPMAAAAPAGSRRRAGREVGGETVRRCSAGRRGRISA